MHFLPSATSSYDARCSKGNVCAARSRHRATLTQTMEKLLVRSSFSAGASAPPEQFVPFPPMRDLAHTLAEFELCLMNFSFAQPKDAVSREKLGPTTTEPDVQEEEDSACVKGP